MELLKYKCQNITVVMDVLARYERPRFLGDLAHPSWLIPTIQVKNNHVSCNNQWMARNFRVGNPLEQWQGARKFEGTGGKSIGNLPGKNMLV